MFDSMVEDASFTGERRLSQEHGEVWLRGHKFIIISDVDRVGDEGSGVHWISKLYSRLWPYAEQDLFNFFVMEYKYKKQKEPQE